MELVEALRLGMTFLMAFRGSTSRAAVGAAGGGVSGEEGGAEAGTGPAPADMRALRCSSRVGESSGTSTEPRRACALRSLGPDLSERRSGAAASSILSAATGESVAAAREARRALVDVPGAEDGAAESSSRGETVSRDALRLPRDIPLGDTSTSLACVGSASKYSESSFFF